jgi:hypothetical protein
MKRTFGSPPVYLGEFEISLIEVMYYLYLPVKFPKTDIRLPPNVAQVLPLIQASLEWGRSQGRDIDNEYVYLSARKGWASPDNPLNRPGWHADGFGSDDLNCVWWDGPGTRFAIQEFGEIDSSHITSLGQFEKRVDERKVMLSPAHSLYGMDQYVVHATPLIEPPGCMRQYIKVSLSPEKYNLENNSHNYLFDYDWKLHSRETLRNDPRGAQGDSVKEEHDPIANAREIVGVGDSANSG